MRCGFAIDVAQLVINSTCSNLCHNANLTHKAGLVRPSLRYLGRSQFMSVGQR